MKETLANKIIIAERDNIAVVLENGKVVSDISNIQNTSGIYVFYARHQTLLYILTLKFRSKINSDFSLAQPNSIFSVRVLMQRRTVVALLRMDIYPALPIIQTATYHPLFDLENLTVLIPCLI